MLKNPNFVKMVFQHDLVFDIHSNHGCIRHSDLCLCAEKQRITIETRIVKQMKTP